MPYVCLNDDMDKRYKNVRVSSVMKRVREERLSSGQRWELRRSMYGNVFKIIDHERMIWYRQDHPVSAAGDLFEGHLPFFCDYCQSIVSHIRPVDYKLTYEMLTRPYTAPKWMKSHQHIFFACCESCADRPLPIPNEIVGYHMTELWQDGKLVFQQERRR